MLLVDPPIQLLCQLITGKVQPSDPRIHPSSWAWLYPLAQQQGMAPLLYWTLQVKGWPASLPAAVRQSLSEAYYASIAYNTLLFNALEKFTALLKQRSIPAVLLKGASLAPSIYPDLGLRPMSDVDCLVSRPEFPQAVELLKGLGYNEEVHEQAPGLRDMSNYHAGIRGGPGNRVLFELHWDLVASPLAWYSVPVNWFWEHTEAWCLDDGIRQLTPMAQLVYLSAHTMLQHGGSQLLLIWLYDIHLLAQSGTIPWDALVDSVNGLRWAGVVAQALRSTQVAFDTNLPEGILKRLDQVADPAIDRLVAFKQHFRGVSLLYDWYSLMALRGRPRLRYTLAMIFPQPSYIRWRYNPRPSWVWPLYYPYRWLRMLAGGILAVKHGILRALK